MKKISIITINYNNSFGLQKTIDSIVEQTFEGFEFLVIDGGSVDGSISIIEKQPRINSWLSEKDNGIYNAQNKGIEKANGDYLLFLNSGDILADKETLEKIAPFLNKSDIVYGDLITESISGERTYEHSEQILNVYHFMISTLWHPCTFIHKSVFEKYGNYNEDFKITADYEFFIRTILKNNVSYKYVSLPICIFNLGGVSNNPGNEKIQLQERKKSWEINFSPIVIDTFESYTKLLRSSEYKIGKKIKNIFGK